MYAAEKENYEDSQLFFQFYFKIHEITNHGNTTEQFKINFTFNDSVRHIINTFSVSVGCIDFI